MTSVKSLSQYYEPSVSSRSRRLFSEERTKNAPLNGSTFDNSGFDAFACSHSNSVKQVHGCACSSTKSSMESKWRVQDICWCCELVALPPVTNRNVRMVKLAVGANPVCTTLSRVESKQTSSLSNSCITKSS